MTPNTECADRSDDEQLGDGLSDAEAASPSSAAASGTVGLKSWGCTGSYNFSTDNG